MCSYSVCQVLEGVNCIMLVWILKCFNLNNLSHWVFQLNLSSCWVPFFWPTSFQQTVTWDKVSEWGKTKPYIQSVYDLVQNVTDAYDWHFAEVSPQQYQPSSGKVQEWAWGQVPEAKAGILKRIWNAWLGSHLLLMNREAFSTGAVWVMMASLCLNTVPQL